MELNKDSYYSSEADKKYMSVSQLKSFMSCEARTMAELNGQAQRVSNKSLLEGSYLHAWNENKLEEFQKKHLEIFKYNNPDKGKLKAYSDIDLIIKSLEKDEIVMDMLEGEKEVIMTANLFDVDWKLQIDIYNPKKKRFVDLKFMNNINKGFWNSEYKAYENFVRFYKYHYQMVLYAILEQLATGREDILEPYMVAVSKEVPPQKIIMNGFLNDITEVLDDVGKRLPRIIKVKNGELEPNYCCECDYCRSVMKTRIINYKNLIIN